MNSYLTLFAVFIAGLSIGWFGHSWLQIDSSMPSATIAVSKEIIAAEKLAPLAVAEQSDASGVSRSNELNSEVDGLQRGNTPLAIRKSERIQSQSSISDTFDKFLNETLYRDAINLYQEQKKQNATIVANLKRRILSQLELLTKAQRYSDFSELIDQYLSVYYDDVEVLLLLADFNHANGNYLEVVDVYLLAKTYAYADIDRQKVLNRINIFVEEIDRWYTQQEDWISLINFYSHLNTAELMTSTHRYRQAIAHLRVGDRDLATAQFELLVEDSVVGKLAAQALSSLANNSVAPVFNSNPAQGFSDSIALQPIGNQYSVSLSNNSDVNIRLLIDTGASITAITSVSFHSLGLDSNAVQRDRRVFRTAGGVVMGTVYSVPELQLGPYRLEDTQVAVIDFETAPEIDGLLGMNILRQFRFQIDQENSELQLSKK